MDREAKDIENELQWLEKMKNQLETEMKAQQIRELEEAMEMEELELQMAELELYETEQEQLERALRESIQEAEARERADVQPGVKPGAVETSSGGSAATSVVETVVAEIAGEKPVLAELSAVRDEAKPDDGKAKRKLPNIQDETAVANPDAGCEAEVDPKVVEAYKSYWSKFRKVATPQNKTLQVAKVESSSDLLQYVLQVL